MRLTVLPFLLLFLHACKRDYAYTGSPEKSPCVPANLPSVRLTKKIVERQYPLFVGTDTTCYAYNAAGQLSSIKQKNQLNEINYRSDGKVDFLKTSNYHPDGIYTITRFFYNNSLLNHTVDEVYNSDGTLKYTAQKKYYLVDANGLVRKIWFEQPSDETVFSYDSCINLVMTQRFYVNTGQEHYLWVGSYDQYFNPEYLIGLNDVFPAEYSPNNPVLTQIVHWDCCDYDASPHEVKYTYNSQGLPITATSTYNNTWYYYE